MRRIMKTMFGKRYPNCVKKTKKEEIEHFFEKKSCNHTLKVKCPEHGMKECPGEKIDEAVKSLRTGNVYLVSFLRGKYMMMKVFFPEVGDLLEKMFKEHWMVSILDANFKDMMLLTINLVNLCDAGMKEVENVDEAAAWTKSHQ